MVELVLFWLIGGLLAVAAGLALARVVTGPSMLDRVVAMEVLTGVLICALGTEAAEDRHTTTLPVLISLSVIGFLATVSVARFVRPQDAPVIPEISGSASTDREEAR
ncbi:monovalent cation/H+ antiporter complex subunit F [Kytococcus sp. Marseille-QA3725]